MPAQLIFNEIVITSYSIHYTKLYEMGRVASHLALEVALQTHANMTLIGEDLCDYIDRNNFV